MDGIGNPVGLITDFALSSYTYTFDPYGAANLTAGGTGNGAAQNPYLFKAGIQDRATGLVKFGLRWYNPTTGTWTQQDTLDAPLDPANANRYAYAGGDPINSSDPEGLDVDWGEAANACLSGAVFTVAAGIINGTTETGVGALADAGVGCLASGALNVLGQETDAEMGTDYLDFLYWGYNLGVGFL